MNIDMKIVAKASALCHMVGSARAMLATGVARSDAQKMLRERYGVSRAKAYRIIGVALNAGPRGAAE